MIAAVLATLAPGQTLAGILPTAMAWVAALAAPSSYSPTAATALRRSLLASYDRQQRPADITNVHFELALQEFTEISTDQQLVGVPIHILVPCTSDTGTSSTATWFRIVLPRCLNPSARSFWDMTAGTCCISDLRCLS